MEIGGVTAEITPGLTRIMEYVVSSEDCPRFLAEKGICVISTPRMIALMEENARKLLDEYLPPAYTSVGYHVDIYHKAPALQGSRLTIRATVLEINGRRVKFHVEATMENKTIGEGIHERVIISWEKFKEKIKE